MTQNLIAAAEAYEQNRRGEQGNERLFVHFGLGVVLLLVCAHFPMTQTLIKIIIAVVASSVKQ